MYGCERWTIKKAEHRWIDAFELRCWRRLLRVPWTARRSNRSILKEISPGCSLEGLMLKLKLQYFGHLMGRTDSFEKTLILGGIGGMRRRGRRRNSLPTPLFLGFPGCSDNKESVWNAGDLGSVPGFGRSPGEGDGNPLHFSCLENSLDRKAWQGERPQKKWNLLIPWSWTSSLQNSGKKFLLFKPPSLWYLAMATLVNEYNT